MVNVVGYIRVSTVNQVKEGYSLGEQLDEIEKYCAANGFNLIHTFSDEGKSGAKTDEDETKIDRDGLQNMLYMIKEGDIQYIVVLSTNRLWRSDAVKFLIHRELKRYSVDVKAIDRPTYSIYTNDPTDTLVTKILLGTLGCVPAFDRYYKNSVKKNHICKGIFDRNSVRNVAEFYCDNLETFENLRHELSECGIEYPPMKLMDMCFWQDAYIDDLKEHKRHLDGSI